MLWTDETSRQLIAEHYPWFLPIFDGYQYPIQRADAIRYFVLHRYGGVYLDLDIGCIRSIDPLLDFDVILPKTIPVGVSNDLMFSAKGHPFMEQVIHGLITFDINYVLNYPTVMFSTGPMFMSAQYGLYTASHPPTPRNPNGEVRILPKSLYGKNAKPGEAPNAFFEHYYGSSWHSDDAWLWTFLGVWGTRLFWVAVVFAVFWGGRIYLMKSQLMSPRVGRRRLMLGRYEVVLPRLRHDRDHTQLDVGPFSVSLPRHNRDESGSSLLSGRSSSPEPSSPDEPLTRYPNSLIPLTFELTPNSPTLSTTSTSSTAVETNSVTDSIRRAGVWMINAITNGAEPRRSRTSRRRHSRGILFFLPAVLAPRSPTPESQPRLSLARRESGGSDLDVPSSRGSRTPRSRSPRPSDVEAGLETVPLIFSGGSGKLASGAHTPVVPSRPMSPAPPPPYASSRTTSPGRALEQAPSSASWESWPTDERP